jgi:bifunctional DNA-binding transcriptional regulator/antitoxin component of YhaV-PrlF toxin-antitoxin module
MLEIATITDNGQVILPPSMAADLSSAGARQFVIYSDGDSIVLKPLKKPDSNDYKAFMQEAQNYAAVNGMKEDDIQDAIRAIRRETPNRPGPG